MNYKAIFGCACLGWIFGWFVIAPAIAMIWPPLLLEHDAHDSTYNGIPVHRENYRFAESTAAGIAKTVAPLAGAICGATIEVVWQRAKRKEGGRIC